MLLFVVKQNRDAPKQLLFLFLLILTLKFTPFCLHRNGAIKEMPENLINARYLINQCLIIINGLNKDKDH
jgi:hypothetical protein